MKWWMHDASRELFAADRDGREAAAWGHAPLRPLRQAQRHLLHLFMNHPLHPFARRSCGGVAPRSAAISTAVVLALLCAAPCRADSQFVGGTGPGPQVARAHLDFRITVLPSIGLRLDAGRYSASATAGALVMGADGPGAAPWVRSVEPGHAVVGGATAAPAAGPQLTLASP